MSADRTVTFGEYGCSKVRCDGTASGHRCTASVTGAFRRGIASARRQAAAAGWQTKVRVQFAPNGWEWRDYCPEHTRVTSPAMPGEPTPQA